MFFADSTNFSLFLSRMQDRMIKDALFSRNRNKQACYDAYFFVSQKINKNASRAEIKEKFKQNNAERQCLTAQDMTW